MRARQATSSDAEAMAAIYNDGIVDRVATFETRLRTADDIRTWFDEIHPIVVVELGGEIVAFASTSSYRPRDCYRRNLEFSVYVARRARGRGAGKLAMQLLIEKAREAGFWKLLSRVFPENTASLRLLRSVGFREIGTYEKHAELDGVWRDVTILERIVAPTVL